MKKDLREVRRQYMHAELSMNNIPEDPLVLFDEWFLAQKESNEYDPTAFTLSTVGMSGFPESRIVLLKEYSAGGFVFFSHYNSQKGVAIAMDNKVSMLFYWPQHSRQIRILGTAKKVDAALSDKYFKERPFESQISASISRQSEKVESREYLENLFKELEASETNETLQRPKNWGGYSIEASEYEFWQGRENRLHDRIRYKLKSNNWVINRLAP